MNREVLVSSLSDLLTQVGDMTSLAAELSQAAVNVAVKVQECARQVMAVTNTLLEELQKP